MEEYATRAIKDPTLDQSRGLGRHTQAEVVSVKLTGVHVPHLPFIYLKEIPPQIKVSPYFN